MEIEIVGPVGREPQKLVSKTGILHFSNDELPVFGNKKSLPFNHHSPDTASDHFTTIINPTSAWRVKPAVDASHKRRPLPGVGTRRAMLSQRGSGAAPAKPLPGGWGL